jgi:hypothetical protein
MFYSHISGPLLTSLQSTFLTASVSASSLLHCSCFSNRTSVQCTPTPSLRRKLPVYPPECSLSHLSHRLSTRDWLWQRKVNSTQMMSIPLSALNAQEPTDGSSIPVSYICLPLRRTLPSSLALILFAGAYTRDYGKAGRFGGQRAYGSDEGDAMTVMHMHFQGLFVNDRPMDWLV